MSAEKSKNILERLGNGEVIIGDGSYVNTLEKRGYVLAGCYTPEASVENPHAVEELAIEYARAGADITQTFTFYSRDVGTPKDVKLTCLEINKASCEIAKKVSNKWGTIVAGGIIQTAAFKQTRDKNDVQAELREGLEVLIQNDIDLIIVEYFRNIVEMEWAIELALSYGKPVAATMCIGPKGDASGVSPAECAVRMAKAGAPIIGINCLFDPFIALETISKMKAGLDGAGLSPYLMCQPLGYRTPDGGSYGWIYLPEFPHAMEPRQVTRYECARFAREAYNLGVRIIGASRKSDLDLSTLKEKEDKGRPEFKGKGCKDYWMNLVPCTGRPLSAPMFRQADPETVNPSVLN